MGRRAGRRLGRLGGTWFASMGDAEQHRHEQQRREGSKKRPPITARPSGAFCPGSIAIGAMPMIMANAVMITGLNRVAPASSAAVSASLPSESCSRAKLTTRMLLAVATPMHMIAPVSAGTDRVVWVRNSIQTMPASAAGSAMMITKGSIQDWKLTTIRR